MAGRKSMTCNPSKLQKYTYITKTPTWKVRSLYFFGIVSWLLVVYGYIFSIGLDPFFSYIVIPIITFLTIYHLTSFGLNLFYKQFDLKKHKLLVESFWDNTNGPSVDIFLPICGEDFHVLENTWKYVSEIPYVNKKVYVLDDSKNQCFEHKKMAEKYGFEYLERPNKGEMKKAGNLKYGFERSSGEYIAIFDADFAPHKDFIKETMPYLEDPKVGIVQTPQYFDTSNDSYKKSHLAYNAAFAEEPFYRIIQATRNRFDGAICCGSNALYRRSALDKIGGPYQIDYSEDAHTGFAITSAGYKVLYIPVNLAVGLCPDNHFAFFHQQHRWSMGSMRLMLSKKFWIAPIPWKTKFCYITGFLFYLHHPFILIFSFHLFWVLFIYNEFIPQGSGLLYYPHLLFAIVYLFAFPIAKIKPGYFEIIIARTYAYSHAVIVSLFRGSVGWVSTNARHSSVSPAYRQTMVVVSTLLTIYFLLLLLGFRTGDIHLLDYRYWSVQFWIFWNVGLSGLLLYQMLRTANVLKNNGSEHLDSTMGNIFGISLVSPRSINPNYQVFKKLLAGEYLLLTLLLIISIALRFYSIGKLSFWNDEIYSFFTIDMKMSELFKLDLNMSFFHVIAKFWVFFIPYSTEGALRALAAVFSVLSVVVVFLLGSEIYAGQKKSTSIALIASVLVTFNAYHIQYAQEFRGYSLLFLLTALSSYLLIKAVQKTKTATSSWWVWYIVVTIASVYTHFFAIFTFLSQIVALAILWFVDKKKFPLPNVLLSLITIAIFIIPLIASALAKGSGQISWIEAPTYDSFMRYALRVTGNQGKPLMILYSCTLVIGLVAFMHALIRKDPHTKFRLVIVVAGLVLPVVLSLVFSYFKTPIFLDRYLILTMPYLALLSSIGIVSLTSIWSKVAPVKLLTTGLSASLVGAMIVLSSFGINTYFSDFTKENWRGLSAYLSENCTSSEDLRLYYMIYMERDASYYNSLLKSQVSDWSKIVGSNPTVDEVAQHIPNLYKRACLTVGHVGGANIKTQKNIEAALSKRFSHMETVKYDSLVVKVFE